MQTFNYACKDYNIIVFFINAEELDPLLDTSDEMQMLCCIYRSSCLTSELTSYLNEQT